MAMVGGGEQAEWWQDGISVRWIVDLKCKKSVLFIYFIYFSTVSHLSKKLA
jgi:hypothetical protein